MNGRWIAVVALVAVVVTACSSSTQPDTTGAKKLADLNSMHMLWQEQAIDDYSYLLTRYDQTWDGLTDWVDSAEIVVQAGVVESIDVNGVDSMVAAYQRATLGWTIDSLFAEAERLIVKDSRTYVRYDSAAAFPTFIKLEGRAGRDAPPGPSLIYEATKFGPLSR